MLRNRHTMGQHTYIRTLSIAMRAGLVDRSSSRTAAGLLLQYRPQAVTPVPSVSKGTSAVSGLLMVPIPSRPGYREGNETPRSQAGTNTLGETLPAAAN